MGGRKRERERVSEKRHGQKDGEIKREGERQTL